MRAEELEEKVERALADAESAAPCGSQNVAMVRAAIRVVVEECIDIIARSEYDVNAMLEHTAGLLPKEGE